MMQDVYEHVRSHGIQLNVTSEVETDTTIVNLVAQGLGATILPSLAAEPIPDSIQVFSLPGPLVRVIGIAVLENALHPPYLCLFRTPETVGCRGTKAGRCYHPRGPRAKGVNFTYRPGPVAFEGLTSYR